MSEPTMIKGETAYIAPYGRNKGCLGYVLAPSTDVPSFNRTLTEDEMMLILEIYTRILKGENLWSSAISTLTISH